MLAVSVLIIGIGSFGVLMPVRLRRLLAARMQQRMLPSLLIARVLVGSTLLVAAGETRFSGAVRVMGVVIVAAAATIPVIGLARIAAIRERISTSLPVGIVRVGALFAIGGGVAFLCMPRCRTALARM